MAEQRSDEWFAERCGKVTASRIADVVARTRSGYGASRANYMAELLVERLTGKPVESYSTPAMQRGVEMEQEAVAAYEFYTGNATEAVGFVPHPKIAMTGASPDRLVGLDGLVEIKCPNTATHIALLLGGEIDNRYRLQMQWQLSCTERMWCDFAPYDPRLPERMALHVRRQPRDDDVIKMLELEVSLFLSELDEKEADLRQRFGG